ncbi:MAG: hypothetical protein PHP31_03805 [Lentimicrobiaceae bacterium]|nr:hypothetical protein [Lentimicrobiaceae bacterium]
MKAFITFSPTVEREVFIQKAKQAIENLGWKYSVNESKLVAEVGKSVLLQEKKLIIDYISKDFVNLTAENPINVADSGESENIIKQFVEEYQKLIC